MLSAKQYLFLRCGKETKSTSEVTRHFNVSTKEVPQTTHLQIYHKLYDDKVDILDGELEDKSQLLDETNYIVRDATDLPTKNIPWDGLFANKSLSLLKEEWFTRNEFSAGILILNIKYNHLGIKHQNSFYPFND